MPTEPWLVTLLFAGLCLMAYLKGFPDLGLFFLAITALVGLMAYWVDHE